MVSSPPTPVILRADNLGRSVHGKTLLESVSFSVYTGEFVAITGPSGSGKSSLLRLLNRLDEPTCGTVYLEGIDYRQIEARYLRRRIGLVTQRPFLFPGTIDDNLRYGPAQHGEAISAESIAELLNKVGLQGFAGRSVANLSGGEAQRVSLARTLANLPQILLLDEPTSSLDEASKIGVELLLQSIVRDQALTCVIVTHDQPQALRLAARALALESGKIVSGGTRRETLHA